MDIIVTIYISIREFHLSGGDPLFSTKTGLLSLSHVHSHMLDCRHVLDIVLDSAGSRASPGNVGSHVFAHAAHPARQFTKSSTTRILHQGKVDPGLSLLTNNPIAIRQYKDGGFKQK